MKRLSKTKRSPKGFLSRDARIDTARIHYTKGGSGPVVILLHGFAETSRMWHSILPALAEKFTVIAPDLPGIGESSIPANAIDVDEWPFPDTSPRTILACQP